MRVGLTLSGDLLNHDGASFAAQFGVTDVVVHLTNHSRNADRTLEQSGGRDLDEPIPDGMVWNVRYRDGRTLTPPVRVSEAELWDRLTFFRNERAKCGAADRPPERPTLKAKKANREDER